MARVGELGLFRLCLPLRPGSVKRTVACGACMTAPSGSRSSGLQMTFRSSLPSARHRSMGDIQGTSGLFSLAPSQRRR
jgi:hypothetical protein